MADTERGQWWRFQLPGNARATVLFDTPVVSAAQIRHLIANLHIAARAMEAEALDAIRNSTEREHADDVDDLAYPEDSGSQIVE